jgi:hypothetical protein
MILVRTPFGGSLMRMVTLSIPVALALCLGAAQLSAQEPGNSTFQWYVGGQGGVMNFETFVQGRDNIPMGGAHLLITARRTGLLLSVEQGFGSNEAGGYVFEHFDSAGTLVDQQAIAVNYDYLRKYSAMLMAFPIKGPMTPFFGIGLGILHAGGFTPDDNAASRLGSSGFGSLIGGLNFKISRFSAFGQYQVTTGPTVQSITQFSEDGKDRFVWQGSMFTGATHTFSAGLRFNLGNARERASGGGY